MKVKGHKDQHLARNPYVKPESYKWGSTEVDKANARDERRRMRG